MTAAFTINNSAVSAFKQRAQLELQRRIQDFGDILRDYIKEIISISVASHGLSLPGFAPHMESGELHNSITSTPQNGGVIVGSDVPYAITLERGLNGIAERPYLVTSLNETMNILEMMVN